MASHCAPIGFSTTDSGQTQSGKSVLAYAVYVQTAPVAQKENEGTLMLEASVAPAPKE